VALKVSLTLESSQQLDKIFSYLLETWSEKIAKEFIKKIYSKTSYIQEFPQLYPLTEIRKNVRRCVILKQVSLYYKNIDSSILILSIFDTRQSPDKLKI